MIQDLHFNIILPQSRDQCKGTSEDWDRGSGLTRELDLDPHSAMVRPTLHVTISKIID